MEIKSSGRSAFVIKAEGSEALIAVNQPSDCLALQRDDIVCRELDAIDVWFGYKFTSQINGPAQPEPPEMWQRALTHILKTYRPYYCIIHTGGTETGLGEEVRLEVDRQDQFRGFWDEKHHVLSLIRRVNGMLLI